jgi:hypothetical protein
MEMFIEILQVVLFVVKLAFSISIIALVTSLGVWASDEYKEVRAARSLELVRTSKIDFSGMVTEKREYEARHRFDKKQKQYRHEPIQTAVSYLEQASEKARKRVLPLGDEHFFAALLKEQKEFAPSW